MWIEPKSAQDGKQTILDVQKTGTWPCPLTSTFSSEVLSGVLLLEGRQVSPLISVPVGDLIHKALEKRVLLQ